jgi:hypothetical protein
MNELREFENFQNWLAKLDFMYGKDTTDGKTDKQIEEQVNRDREKIERLNR